MIEKVAEPLPGLLHLRPRVFRDDRGWFMESHHRAKLEDLGVTAAFVQDNVSFSRKHVLRGLHAQCPHAQDKLVMVLHGTVWDVAVDLRQGSPTFGRWYGAQLDDQSHDQLFIPRGFAHGFVVLSEEAVFSYKCSAPYDAAAEFGIRWNDPDLAIRWPVEIPILSPKDADAPFLAHLPTARLAVSFASAT